MGAGARRVRWRWRAPPPPPVRSLRGRRDQRSSRSTRRRRWPTARRPLLSRPWCLGRGERPPGRRRAEPWPTHRRPPPGRPGRRRRRPPVRRSSAVGRMAGHRPPALSTGAPRSTGRATGREWPTGSAWRRPTVASRPVATAAAGRRRRRWPPGRGDRSPPRWSRPAGPVGRPARPGGPLPDRPGARGRADRPRCAAHPRRRPDPPVRGIAGRRGSVRGRRAHPRGGPRSPIGSRRRGRWWGWHRPGTGADRPPVLLDRGVHRRRQHPSRRRRCARPRRSGRRPMPPATVSGTRGPVCGSRSGARSATHRLPGRPGARRWRGPVRGPGHRDRRRSSRPASGPPPRYPGRCRHRDRCSLRPGPPEQGRPRSHPPPGPVPDVASVQCSTGAPAVGYGRRCRPTIGWSVEPSGR